MSICVHPWEIVIKPQILRTHRCLSVFIRVDLPNPACYTCPSAFIRGKSLPPYLWLKFRISCTTKPQQKPLSAAINGQALSTGSQIRKKEILQVVVNRNVSWSSFSHELSFLSRHFSFYQPECPDFSASPTTTHFRHKSPLEEPTTFFPRIGRTSPGNYR